MVTQDKKKHILFYDSNSKFVPVLTRSKLPKHLRVPSFYINWEKKIASKMRVLWVCVCQHVWKHLNRITTISGVKSVEKTCFWSLTWHCKPLSSCFSNKHIFFFKLFDVVHFYHTYFEMWTFTITNNLSKTGAIVRFKAMMSANSLFIWSLARRNACVEAFYFILLWEKNPVPTKCSFISPNLMCSFSKNSFNLWKIKKNMKNPSNFITIHIMELCWNEKLK